MGRRQRPTDLVKVQYPTNFDVVPVPSWHTPEMVVELLKFVDPSIAPLSLKKPTWKGRRMLGSLLSCGNATAGYRIRFPRTLAATASLSAETGERCLSLFTRISWKAI